MSLSVGDPAPDFTLQDDTNTAVTLSALRGRNVVVIFYPFDFSPVCTAELKEIARTQDRYHAAGAEVLGISVDTWYAHAAFKRDEGISARLLADFHPKGRVAQLYGAYVEDGGFAGRYTFVVDSGGIIRHIAISSVPQARNPNQYVEALAACPV